MAYIAFILFFIPLPILLGTPFLKLSDRKPYPLLFSWVFGFLFLFAAGYVPALIGVLRDSSLTSVFIAWMIILIAAACFSLLYLLRHKQDFSASIKSISEFFKNISVPEVICILLVLVHAYVVFRYMHIDDDDAVYVAAATTSLDTNTVMHFNSMTGDLLTPGSFISNGFARISVSPLHVLYACISKLFGIRPAALAHSYLPPFLTILFYACIAMTGSVLFHRDRKKAAVFTIFVYLVNVCSYVSVYTSGTFLSIRSWQGKGFFVGAAIPLLLWYYMQLNEKAGLVTVRGTAVFLLLYVSAALMTVMGLALLCIMGLVLSCLVTIYTRKIRVFVQYALCMIFPAAIIFIYSTINTKGI